MDLTVQNVFGLILRGKLMSAEGAKAMMLRWKEESKAEFANLGKFAAWLVNRKYVTEYQASLLIRGHGEGFFVNSYKILERLGKGRMGGVYKAEHETGQIVALKVLPPSKSRERNFLMRFHREAQMTMELVHNNIVRTFETGVCNGLHYMVMEYLAGETIEHFLKKSGKMKPAEACHIIYQALRGLDSIYKNGLVHRDLKPANMMLAGDPKSTKVLDKTLKILDMGLGKLAKNKEPLHQAATALHLTDEGVLLGTPDYMAPEQARDARSIDIRADIYSLGCVLYHLLTGQPPFPDSNIVNQMIRHATEIPKPASDLNSLVPEGLNQILQYMLAKDPASRYQTPERCAQALAIFLNAGPVVQSAVSDSENRLKKYLTWLETEKTSIKEKPNNKPQDGMLYDPPSETGTDSDSDPDPDPDDGSEFSVKLISNFSNDSDPLAFENPDPIYKSKKKKSSPSNPFGFNLSWVTKKELVLIGLGVGFGALATLIGCIVALSFGAPTKNLSDNIPLVAPKSDDLK